MDTRLRSSPHRASLSKVRAKGSVQSRLAVFEKQNEESLKVTKLRSRESLSRERGRALARHAYNEQWLDSPKNDRERSLSRSSQLSSYSARGTLSNSNSVPTSPVMNRVRKLSPRMRRDSASSAFSEGGAPPPTSPSYAASPLRSPSASHSRHAAAAAVAGTPGGTASPPLASPKRVRKVSARIRAADGASSMLPPGDDTPGVSRSASRSLQAGVPGGTVSPASTPKRVLKVSSKVRTDTVRGDTSSSVMLRDDTPGSPATPLRLPRQRSVSRSTSSPLRARAPGSVTVASLPTPKRVRKVSSGARTDSVSSEKSSLSRKRGGSVRSKSKLKAKRQAEDLVSRVHERRERSSSVRERTEKSDSKRSSRLSKRLSMTDPRRVISRRNSKGYLHELHKYTEEQETEEHETKLQNEQTQVEGRTKLSDASVETGNPEIESGPKMSNKRVYAARLDSLPNIFDDSASDTSVASLPIPGSRNDSPGAKRSKSSRRSRSRSTRSATGNGKRSVSDLLELRERIAVELVKETGDVLQLLRQVHIHFCTFSYQSFYFCT